MAVPLVIMIGGAYGGSNAYLDLRAQITEITWRFDEIEQSVSTVELDALAGSVQVLNEAVSTLREELVVLAAAAETSDARSVEASSTAVQLGARVDELETQVRNVETRANDIAAGFHALETSLAGTPELLDPLPELTASPEVDRRLDEIAEPATRSASDPAPMELRLVTSDTTWVRVASESEGSLFEGLLEPTQALRVSSDAQPVVVRLGNGGQVYAVINGVFHGPFGELGSVVDFSEVDDEFIVANLPAVDQIPTTEGTARNEAQPPAYARPAPRPVN